ncbi:helicase-related protein [Hyphococcus sp. DH-69]|uniref:helicase-related protein n=1 Tax=Hyphococcus formosus TaxID=3143534 RepID=UPI00398A93A8
MIDQFSPTGGGRVCAVLGPTNTGKTHYALERMLAHKSGMIGLPLRLLAREIYDRILKSKNPREVALVTGEEKIIPPNPRYWVATVEAMPLERTVEFMAIDEIQLAADTERGRIFTSRILHARGTSETLLLGSHTMRPILQRMFGNIQFLSRERFSNLSYTGSKKATRLPRRSAIVGFSSDTVYSIAELIRRQRGGAAVVLGALSPRTRNAQAELYQSGEVDFLVATDAIGMGLNMDIDHVAFSATRKFDGHRARNLLPTEMAQIAGRAGRHIRDGTFGVTGDCAPIDEDLVTAIENHEFDSVTKLLWRTEKLDFSSLPALIRSLDQPPPRDFFVRSRREDDEDALHRLCNRAEIREIAKGGAALATLWDICQIPDFRKIGGDQHARMLGDIYTHIMNDGRISESWMEPQITRLDRTDGDIDALSSRLAHVRTWTYLSHRSAWIDCAPYWQERARAIEDSLSDALHEKLTQRFVDRRTSTLLKRLKDNAPLLAGVTEDGEVIVEGQFIGRLLGFEFIVDPRASGAEAKSLRAAGEKALTPVLAARAAALANAEGEELQLDEDGTILWRSGPVAKIQKGPAPLRPEVVVTGIGDITPNLRGRVEDRLKAFVTNKIEGLLGPLVALQVAANSEGENGLKGLTKGVAYRLAENFGATSRSQIGDDLKQIDQDERAKLRKLGMRFGEFTLFMPALLKPAPASLLTLLWALWTDRRPGDVPPPSAGRVSIELNESLPHAYYYAGGYRPSGTRAVRIDMLERLAGLIRTARNESNPKEGFETNAQMMSLVGCSGEDFEAILRSLGFRKNVVKRKVPVTKDLAAPEKQNDAPAAAPATPADDTATAPESTPNDAAPEAAMGDKAPEAAPQRSVKAEEAAEEQEIEVSLWRPAMRRPKHTGKPAQNRNKGEQRDNRGRGPNQNKGKGRGPKNASRNAGGRPGHGKGGSNRPPREKKADPNSPFAVLAGLKAELSDGDENAKSKAPEKTE